MVGSVLGASHWRSHRGETMVASYAHNLSRRLPLLSLLVILGVGLVIMRFIGTVRWPVLLPGVAMMAFAAERGWHWLPSQVAQRPLARRRKDIVTLPMSVGLSALFAVSWALSLYCVGNDAQRALVRVLLSVVSVAGVLGLAHAPAAALRLALTCTVPAAIVYLAVDGAGVWPVVVVLTMANLTVLMMTFGFHADFVRLELSRQQLARRERLAARLAQTNFEQASRDPLTGGLNRRAILARLAQEVTRHDAPQPWLALLDLDGFKHINDTYGHAAGDDVLRAVSRRIDAIGGVVAHGRLGGDEFAILFDGALDGPGVAAAAHALSQAVRAPVVHNGVTLRLHASTGIHRMRGANAGAANVGGHAVGACLERADAALYKAKKRGEGAIVLFGPEDEVALQHRSAMTRQFNGCRLDDRLRLLYQPFYDVDSGAVLGFEAFARWSPDGQTWLAPGEFMHLATATGRTGELTRAVIARTLAECDAWRRGLTVAINLSPRDVTREGAVESLDRLVRDAGADPARFLLEMNEAALLADPRRARTQLEAFRAAGFRLALDDFGAGWSSLSQLRDLPLDMVKIDRGLAAALSSDPGARAIVGTIVSFAWQLGIECMIEGVEDEAQLATARALGIRLMQGYHLGRPERADVALAAMDRAVA
ncbi:putative bifunctional diguanylate cyclase/phosphodiesterase [Novosphingobium rhizosphaerae]|uniref:putative bifunctional diguanylate cyclase/phosphodiesterase n=1 Tax=Novosphingobium rhizosphaerae TaxID=1551649 RepID=UPI00181AA509